MFAWLTDIHLNWLSPRERIKFYQRINLENIKAFIISGDIGEGDSVGFLLNEMQCFLKKTIYYVLGNHDYYKATVADVHQNMELLVKDNLELRWLSIEKEPISIESDVYLVGQDGWADGRYGNYANSSVVLNDSLLIEDFRAVHEDKNQLLACMQQLADQDALKLKQSLNDVVSKHAKEVIVITHVPPFRENCFYNNVMSNDDYLPFFSSKATGDVLMEVAAANPDINFRVLCGHTHHESTYEPLSNLMIKSGAAKYSKPCVSSYIDIQSNRVPTTELQMKSK